MRERRTGSTWARWSGSSAEPEVALPDEYAQLGDTVRRALDELAEQYQHVEKKFDDAAWVGARLTELLPIELNDKQALLELDDPVERLDALLGLVPGDGATTRSGSIFRRRTTSTAPRRSRAVQPAPSSR